MEQANSPGLYDKASLALSGSSRGDNTIESQYGDEYLSLKVCQRNHSSTIFSCLLDQPSVFYKEAGAIPIY